MRYFFVGTLSDHLQLEILKWEAHGTRTSKLARTGNVPIICLKHAQSLGSYPGVGCDVPSHSYTYGFEPNAEWDGYYAHGHQIQKYFVDFCEKYNLRRFIEFESRVVAAVWLEDEGECMLPQRIPTIVGPGTVH